MTNTEGPNSPFINSEASKVPEGFEVISSSVDAFIAEQDNAEWRKDKLEEWRNFFIKRYADREEKVRSEILSMVEDLLRDNGGILIPLSYWIDPENGPSPRPFTNNISMYAADDNGMEPGNFLKQFEEAIKENSPGDYKLVSDPERTCHFENGSVQYKWSVVGGETPGGLYITRNTEVHNDFKHGWFRDPRLTQELYDQAGPFSYYINLTSLPGSYSAEWEPHKRLIEFFRDQNLNFLLTEKGGGIYTHHFVKKSE